jgi:hypothetical protein
MAREPLVSIIITSYNYEKYVENCIRSCMSQVDYHDYEVIVVDDGSTDSTSEIIEEYKADVRIERLENQGVERASNHGINMARGRYVVRVDADDLLEPNYLQVMSKCFDQADWSFLYSNYFVVGESGEKLREVELPMFDPVEIKERGDFLATGTIYRKQEIKNLGLCNESVKNCGLENYELILKILQNSKSGKLVQEPLFCYRKHSGNMSLTRRDSIIEFGGKLAGCYGLSEYIANKNHPYGLVI